MKKLLFICLLLGCNLFFAEVFKDSETYVESFLESQKYIKIYRDKNNIRYIPLNSVSQIDIDEDDFKITTIIINDEKESETYNFSIRKWSISNDENGNIIIKQK